MDAESRMQELASQVAELQRTIARKYRAAAWLAETLAYLSGATLGERTADEWMRVAEQETEEDADGR